jgi:hypothetical protein
MLAAAGIVVATRFVSQPKRVEPPDVRLNAALSCGDGEIQVTNNDTAGWMEARVEINSKYVRIVPAIPPAQTVSIPAAEFTDTNGRRFDSSAKCESAGVQAFIRGGRGQYTQAFPR